MLINVFLKDLMGKSIFHRKVTLFWGILDQNSYFIVSIILVITCRHQVNAMMIMEHYKTENI